MPILQQAKAEYREAAMTIGDRGYLSVPLSKGEGVEQSPEKERHANRETALMFLSPSFREPAPPRVRWRRSPVSVRHGRTSTSQFP